MKKHLTPTGFPDTIEAHIGAILIKSQAIFGWQSLYGKSIWRIAVILPGQITEGDPARMRYFIIFGAVEDFKITSEFSGSPGRAPERKGRADGRQENTVASGIFVAAMELELAENREDLIYEREHNLNTKPLQIDLLVIKKEPGARIANEIGEIFRGHNIIEYKSPKESLDIDVFYKTQAYAGLYKAYGSGVDERRAEDITVTMIRNGKPRELFRYFTKHDIHADKVYPGIYYVHGAGMFPTQIIVARELNKESHIWLKALSDRLQKQEMAALLEQVQAMTQKKEQALAGSVLRVSARANLKIIEDLRGEYSMGDALLELMKPEIDKIVADAVATTKAEAAKATAKAVAATKAEAAKAAAKAAAAKADAAARKSIVCAVKSFRDLGASDQEIKRLLTENYGLSPREADKYL